MTAGTVRERSVARRGIPQYFLYGEATHDVDERFLHVESIAERSRLHDWKIRPHAHQDLHHFLLVTRGGGVFYAEGELNPFNHNALISVPLACVHGFDFKPGTDGWILTASGALIERIAHENAELRPVLTEANAMPLPADVTAGMVTNFESLMMEFRSNLPGRRTAAEALLIGILVAALRRKLQLLPNRQSKTGADSLLASKYRGLIEEHFRTTLKVADYAKRLCVSSERLRQACVRSTASSPLALLNARRLLEAKRSLLYTGMSVGLIAEACGFPDPAYFSRFFTQRTGVSPMAYRTKQQRAYAREN
ncbi:AraC family transcriptional regulator [Steroidobacter agaridevorans]|uniref:AraC family transcriptional regulator n=1 Tax=Steroidobacter agaridevorans TaxID=2695856 RepID=A0A829YHM1_9GAMM|nr:AraC family transcriptional regulator [Steroidobacter agaridevorans]GFE85330.1 AraC family transcriptional regulator [Steroidobacter agaridevorans]